MENNKIELNQKTYCKMMFIQNALNEGWSVKKKENTYIFTMKHKGKCEVFKEEYLEEFITKNINKN